MASRRLAEEAVTLIQAEIKSKISAALAEVRTDRGDAKVTTEPPKKYFLYERAKGLETPCVFIICTDMRMHNSDRAANFIASQARIVVSVLVEDRIADNLVTKSWRYQAALHKVLHLVDLTSTDSKVKIVIKVDTMAFSPEFSTADDPSIPEGVFRKEVALELEVEHWENLN